MWPKALAQLIELAPHVSRLLPMADRFFQSKSASEESTRRAMDAMAEGLRGDLGQVTAAHSGLYRKFEEQSEVLAGLATDVSLLKASEEGIAERLTSLEGKFSALMKLVVLLLLVNMAVAVLLAVLLVRRH